MLRCSGFVPSGLRGLTLLSLLGTAACGGAQTSPEAPKITPFSPEEGKRVHFEYTTLEGRTLSTASLAGRLSVLGFIATYDHPASELQARFINRLVRTHTPRINVGLIILEPPENRPMAEAFVHVLGLTCPVAMAGKAELRGGEPFLGMSSVPSTLILDQQGREVFRYHGVLDENGLEKALRALEKPSSQTGR